VTAARASAVRPTKPERIVPNRARRVCGENVPQRQMRLRPSMRASHVSKTASGSVSKGVIGSASRVSTSESVPELEFEAVVAADARRLYTLALSILRDEGEAEDAVQETLLKAWRSWPSISQSDHLAPWLTRVCVNHCTSMRRHLRARGWPPLALFEAAGSSGRQSSPAEIIDVDRAYRRLSIRQRAAITLNYRYGYSIEESAGFMGCRPGTVRTHIARGLTSLRKELGDA
jgi:RNA polymerase sigma factor (sigma-70 family)